MPFSLCYMDNVKFNSFLFYSLIVSGLHSDSFLREINYPRQKGRRTASEQQGRGSGSGYFCRIRISWSVQDPDNFVRTGNFRQVRIYFSDPKYFFRIRIFFSDPDFFLNPNIFVGFVNFLPDFCWNRIFWLDPNILSVPDNFIGSG